MLTGYLAAAGFEAELAHELTHLHGAPPVACHGRLMLAEGPPLRPAWAANVWHAPVEMPIASIGEAARGLRALQRNWQLYAVAHHRRAALIADRLPHVSARPLAFPDPPPASPLGSWTLLAPDRLLAAPRCDSPFPNGEAAFVEDREGPPNRAYLKLWEALTRLGVRPAPGSLCLDLGASPGGWSWVLARLGAEVVAVDKAPLDPRVAALPGVRWRQESAFALAPGAFPAVDWLFCDVICYPRRLLALVRRWLEAGRARRFVCTVKFQGETDHEAVAAFAALPGRLVHLHHNKHELTWLCPAPAF